MDLSRTTEIANRLCESAGWGDPEYIDHGNSAAVYCVVHPEHGKAALKIYDPAFFEGDNALIEANRVKLQEGLKGHGNINLIEVLGIGELAEDGTWYLLMEYCPWKSLEKRLADVPDGQVHCLLRQLTNAVMFLNDQGFVHRDIKPANIAVSDDFAQLKLLDLGVLRKIGREEGSGTADRKFIATAQYSPPEFLSREEDTGQSGFDAINIYQIGAVLHDLIMKVPIFFEEVSTQNKFILYKAVLEKIPRIANPNIPARLISICNLSLNKSPEARTSAVKLSDFLADADSAHILRRRVSQAGTRQPATAPPSLVVWQNQLRSWIGAAARLERQSLGAARIVDTPIPHGLSWVVHFKQASSSVTVEVLSDGTRLALYVVTPTEPPVRNVVFEVTGDGADLDPGDIPAAISHQFLYALDLMLASMGPNEGLEDTTEKSR